MKHIKIITNYKAICIGNTLLKLTTLPFSMFIATLISHIMTLAMEGNTEAVLKAVLYSATMITATILIRLTSDCYLKQLNANRSSQFRTDFMRIFLHNPADMLHDVSKGALIQNINKDLDTIINCYTQVYPDIISNAITVMAYIVFMILQQPFVAFALLGLGLFQLFPPFIVRKYIQINYDNCSKLEEEITDHLSEAVKGFPFIKLYALKDTWIEKLSVLYRKYYIVGNRSSAALAAHSSLLRCTETVLRFGSYIIVGLFILNQVCSFECGVQVLYLSSGLFSAINTIANNIPHATLRKTAENRMCKWTDVSNLGNDCVIRSPFSQIQFRDVSITYDEKEVFHHIQCNFRADQEYCIIGSNGSGKSTLLYAIMKEIKTQSGTILLDHNADYNGISADILAFVPQNMPVFSLDAETLFGLFEDASYTERAVKIMQSLGLDSCILVGKGINTYSGGERKKLFLSLAFAMEPQWMLLDEPTNHLDEQSVMCLIELLRKKKGIILVTHDERLRQIIPHIIRIEDGVMTNE